MDGNCAYTYVEIKNGAVVPGSTSTSPFLLAGQNGLPLTKQYYKFQRLNPKSNFILSSKSTMELKVSHTVARLDGTSIRFQLASIWT